MLYRSLVTTLALTLLLPTVPRLGEANIQEGADRSHHPVIAYTQTIEVGSSAFQIDFATGTLDVSQEKVVQRIQTAAGRRGWVLWSGFPLRAPGSWSFPYPRGHGVLQGTTWGNRDGVPALVRLPDRERSTSTQELAADWVITHELVHTALSSLPDDQNWLEEGLASYVEPIARAQAGDLTPDELWGGMIRGMKNGEPVPGDRGLNHTHTWGRTYWGGALFCPHGSDLEIRRQTGNKKGLEDALRGVVAAGGTIDTEWPVSRILALGDGATGTPVLQTMYSQWSEKPVEVDLTALWKQLGVRMDKDGVTFDPRSPLASIRLKIMEPRDSASQLARGSHKVVTDSWFTPPMCSFKTRVSRCSSGTHCVVSRRSCTSCFHGTHS